MQPGDTISQRYRLLRLLEVGGMGEVWAARNELTQRDFAIKFLLPAAAERPDALERFLREAQTAGRLRHASIVDVYDVAQDEDGRPYIVMELLAGESLENRLEREGRLPPVRAAAILSQVAFALDLAHGAGVVHRDLSPANIFLARGRDGGEPIPKILDFGISKTLGIELEDGVRTANGVVLGCPSYMSPEQACGAEALDARTDVWSLGAVLYECLTGTAPFRATNYNALMVAIMTRRHRPVLEVVPGLDRELAAVVEGCLQKEREDRIRTAFQVGERLGGVVRRLAGDPVRAGLTPGRRVTDRLPPVGDPDERRRLLESVPPGLLPAGVRAFRWLAGARPRRTVVGIAGAVLGAAIGAAAAGHGRPHAAGDGIAQPHSLVEPASPRIGSVVTATPDREQAAAGPAAASPPGGPESLAEVVARALRRDGSPASR